MSEELTLRDLYLILKRHWKWVVLTPVALGILAFVYTAFVARPEYRATTTLSIQTTIIQSRLEDRIDNADAPVLNREQVETVALSRPVLETVLKSLPEEDRPRDTVGLAERLKVKFVSQQTQTPVNRLNANLTPLVTMDARAGTPKLAAEIANTWAKATLDTLNQLPQIRLSDSIVTLNKQIGDARAQLTTAEKQVQTFNTSSTLALDQATLTAAVTERSQLNSRLSDAESVLQAAETELGVRRGELQTAQNAFDLGGSGEATALAASGTSLTQVRADLQQALEAARARFDQAAEAQRVFNTSDDRSLLRGRLTTSETRLVQINSALQSYDSRLKTLETRLSETKRQIAEQPRLLTLEREITADPAIAAAIQQNNQNLGDLVGLKLENQELNPVYTSLLQTSVQLQADLKVIATEREAFITEQSRLTKQVETDRARIAQLDQQARKLEIQLGNAQGVYQAAQARANRLTDVDLGNRKLDGVQPEYQRLRTVVSDLEANRSKLSVNLSSLQARARALDSQIATLKQRVSDQTLRSSRFTQNLELYREQLKILEQKLTDFQIERASAGNLAQVFLPAYAPTRRANSALLPVALATVIGLLIGLIVPFILEALRDPNRQVQQPLEKPGFAPASAD
jgi:uncharacterized protein involved in exopolysaccharide biosynthesis